MTRSLLGTITLVLLIVYPSSAQQSTVSVTKDPTAIALATKALTALLGANQLEDVTLTGTATRTAGSNVDSGSVTLTALGFTNSRMHLEFSSGTWDEIRTSPNGVSQGWWRTPGTGFNTMATHNCFSEPVWFFPTLGMLSQVSTPNLSIEYIGQETRNSKSVEHLRLAYNSISLPAGDVDPLPALSATDVYLDVLSFLPTAIVFNVHPDDNETASIPVEIDFSNYQTSSGVQVPRHIQKLFNGSVLVDIQIQDVNINSGLTASAFSVD